LNALLRFSGVDLGNLRFCLRQKVTECSHA
jgi:hypothetical protein